MVWRKLAVVAICGLTLSACGPKAAEEKTAAASAAPPACRSEATTAWNAAAKTTLTITGKYEGDCVSGDANLIITSPEGAQVYTFALPVSVAANTVFADAKNQMAMAIALAKWIEPGANTTMQTTGALPAWAAKDEEPGNGEFPFMPSISREDYAALRKKNVPLYCHIQGGESQACMIYDVAAKKITQVGLQRFPG
jgi:hypothetical protein